MVICRTPFRISFFGGGTDYPIWYREHGGAVINTTIDKYSYINVRWLPPFFDYKYRIRYFLKEEASTIEDVAHPSVRECVKFLGITGGLEIVHNADLPAQSGLGSSSAFTVGMLHSLYALNRKMVSKQDLALQAIEVEQNIIGEAVGSQDQTAAAFGGLNLIRFEQTGHVEVDKVIVPQERIDQLESNLLLVFTGFSRNAVEIAKVQIELTPVKSAELRQMQVLCEEALTCLTSLSTSVDEFGRMLHEQWLLKKSVSALISNSEIDSIYDAARNAGAIGGKLLGAGGGGFMLFYVNHENRQSVVHALRGKLVVPFRFEHAGSKIIYFNNQPIPALDV